MNLTNTTNGNGNVSFPSKDITCSQPMQFQNILHTAFLILILIVTFTGNLLVVLAVVFFRRLRSITNYFIVSLAVSDLLVSLLSLPFKIDQTAHNYSWCLNMVACKTFISLDTICSFASIWNLVIISIDRFIAITQPFQYHSLITTNVGYGMIGFVWGFSSFLALMQLLNWTNPGEKHIFIDFECQNRDKVYYTVTAAISFFLPLAIIIVMYAFVFRVALNQAKALAALQVDARRRGGRRSSINLVREVKAAKTLAIVIGCFIICWFPFAVLIQVNLRSRELFEAIPLEHLKALNITFVYVLPPLNSTMNPVIYALFNRDFRSAFWKLVKRLTGRRLGAVGFGEGTGSNLESSVSANQKKNGGPTRGIQFQTRESQSSDNPLPTVAIQDPNVYLNVAYNGQSRSAGNNLNVTPSTLPSKTDLDIDHKIEANMDTPLQNGCVSSDEGETQTVDKSVKLPPLERTPSLGNGRANIVKSGTLPPIKPNNLNDHHTDDTSTNCVEKLDNDMEDKSAEKTLEDSQPNAKDNDSS